MTKSIVERYDFDTIVGGVLHLINDPSLLGKYHKFLKCSHNWFFKDDTSEDKVALREMINILCAIFECNEHVDLTLESFESKIIGRILDSDKGEKYKQKYISWKMDENIKCKINDKGVLNEFINYLKIIRIGKAAATFKEQYHDGSINNAMKTMMGAFHDANQLDLGRCEAFEGNEITRLLKNEEEYSDSQFQANTSLFLGLEPFDVYTGGYDTQTLNVFISRTNGGKSMMAVHLIRQCILQKIPCWVGVLEDRKKSFLYRLTAAITGIRIGRLRRNADMLTPDEWNKINLAQELINKYIRIEFIYGKDVHQVNKMALDYDLHCSLTRRERPVVNIVDYSGHVASRTPGQKMHEKFRDTFAARKDFALENKKICFDFAQVNRDGSKKITTGVNFVTQEDLSSAFDLAQVCDNIISINRGTQEEAEGTVKLAFTKAKDGFTGYCVIVKAEFERGRFNMGTIIDSEGKRVPAWKYDELYMPPEVMREEIKSLKMENLIPHYEDQFEDEGVYGATV